jgi:hypothetical protein
MALPHTVSIAMFAQIQSFIGHCKLNEQRSRISFSAFAYAACRHAISFHNSMAAVLSSR